MIYTPEHAVVLQDEAGNKFDYDIGDCINSDENIEKRCDACNANTPHTKRSTFHVKPPNLFIDLKLFKKKKVLFYETICLTAQKNTSTYFLKGIVKHSGSTTGGHYSCYINDSDGWHHYNDSTITPIDDIEVIINSPSFSSSYPLLWYQFSDDLDEDESDFSDPEAIVQEAPIA